MAADPCVPAAPGLSVLVVEWRDEAFARLAADLTGAGVRVVRGKNPKTAARRYLREPTDAVFVSARQPCESPWLFAAKLRLTHPRARVWVYTPSASPRDKEKAALLLHATPIEYGGDLSRLSREILSRLADFPQHAWS